MLGILAKRHVGPSKAGVVPCSTCFIRCTSGSTSSRNSAGCLRYLRPNDRHRSSSSIGQRNPSALSRSSMRREHCGNFSVADIVMSAEVLQRAGGYPAPPRRAARCSVLPCSRGNCSPGHAVVLHAKWVTTRQTALAARPHILRNVPGSVSV